MGGDGGSRRGERMHAIAGTVPTAHLDLDLLHLEIDVRAHPVHGDAVPKLVLEVVRRVVHVDARTGGRLELRPFLGSALDETLAGHLWKVEAPW